MQEGARGHRPAGDFRRVVDQRLHAHDFFAEFRNHVGGDPRRAKACGDFRGFEVFRHGLLQRVDVALEAGVFARGFGGDRQALADVAGQIGVGGVPSSRPVLCATGSRKMRSPSSAVAVSRATPKSSAIRSRSTMSGFVEHDGERVGRAGDFRRGRRVQHALAEDRSLAGVAGFDVVVLDRGDQPDVGIVEEGLEIGPAHGFADLAVGRRWFR